MKARSYTETVMKSRPWIAFPPRNLKKSQDFSEATAECLAVFQCPTQYLNSAQEMLQNPSEPKFHLNPYRIRQGIL